MEKNKEKDKDNVQKAKELTVFFVTGAGIVGGVALSLLMKHRHELGVGISDDGAILKDNNHESDSIE